ncbi:MAG: DUF2961 domain-containing protein [Candidatus Hydrogenedentes bacterium]|nr:DUF2961 domain-containing protein [Candidatus Hydrogenedentota bacterium]
MIQLFTLTLAALFLLPPLAALAGPAGNAGDPLAGLAQLKIGQSMRASSTDPNLESGNGDARPIEPGATLVLADLTGPGVITHFWNTIAASDHGYSRMLVLRMYWDGEEHASVECPIGDFFGIGHGVDQPFTSTPISVSSEGRARNCYWPMPFGKSAKITVTNEGAGKVHAFYYYVDWTKLPSLPADTAYFHAMYRQEFPATMGQNYLIADIEGRGHYVGTILSVRQLTPSWFGEGDDFFYIDGETTPRLTGTGTEDYFCDAWGFRQFSYPYYGVPLYSSMDAFALTTAYRWHITDPVIFEKSLRMEIEHKGVTFNEDGSIKSGFEERPDDFSSVALWYQIEPHKAYPALPPAKDRLYHDWTKLVEVDQALDRVTATEGPITRQEGAQWTGGGQVFWQPAKEGQTLNVPIEIAEEGDHELLLLMTRSFDYGNYEVQIDGKPLGAPLDLYTSNVTTKEFAFRTGTLSKGPHTLSFVSRGKKPESTGYYFGFDGYLLNRLK